MPTFGNIHICDEVFQEVLSYTPRKCLSVFSLVSWSWHASTTPVLYREINLVWRRSRYLCSRHSRHAMCPCERTGTCNQNNHPEDRRANSPCLEKVTSSPLETLPPLYLLVRTLLHSPAYAGFVRCLRLVGAVPSSVWATIGQTGLSIHDRERIEHILHESHSTICSTKSWIHELEQGSSSAFAAFLLVYLTRLETIEIGAEFSQLFSFIGISTIRELKRLTSASIGTFRDEVYMNTGRNPLVQSDGLLYPLLFFYTPNVRQLSLNLPKPLENVGFEWPIKDLVPLTTSLESLELTFTFFGEHDLAHILKACPNLRTLKYDLWTATEDIASPNVRVDLSTLQRALSPVESTLETLQLHIGKYHWTSGSWNDEWEDVHGYLTFHDYPRLSMLHVPIRVLTECQSWPMGDATTYHKMMVMRMRNVASVDLGAKLPKSLTCLWINLDGFDFPLGDLEGALPLFDDEELAIVLAATLDRRQTYTPLLKTLKILVSQVPYIVWEQWDSDVISNALAARDLGHGVDVSIDPVFYRCFPSVPFCVDRQLPPYFDQEMIDKNRMLEKGPMGSTGGTRVLQYR